MSRYEQSAMGPEVWPRGSAWGAWIEIWDSVLKDSRSFQWTRGKDRLSGEGYLEDGGVKVKDHDRARGV